MNNDKNSLLFHLCSYLINGITQSGGWGSEYLAQKEDSPMNTGEVLCALIMARRHLLFSRLPENMDCAIDRGIKYLLKKQLPSGGWATASGYSDNTMLIRGNVSSTSFVVWALVEHIRTWGNQCTPDILKSVQNSANFILSCKQDRLYKYHPGNDDINMMASSYALMALSNIYALAEGIYEKEFIEKLNNEIQSLSNSLLSTLMDSKNNYFTNVIILLGLKRYILAISPNQSVEPSIKNLFQYVEKAVCDFTVIQCIENFIEKQMVVEEDRIARDFTHFAPAWILSAVAHENMTMQFKYYKQVLKKLQTAIDTEFEGVYCGNKRYTWSTALTVVALCIYSDNMFLDDLFKVIEYAQEEIEQKKNNKIFIIHGRNMEILESIKMFLSLLGLQAITWDYMRATGNATSDYAYSVLQSSLEESGAVLVLFSGDDEGKCRDDFLQPNDDHYETTLCPQPRLNVVFEAGMAFAMQKDKTIIVKAGSLREFSDIKGINFIRYEDTDSCKKNLINELKKIGCVIPDDHTLCFRVKFSE